MSQNNNSQNNNITFTVVMLQDITFKTSALGPRQRLLACADIAIHLQTSISRTCFLLDVQKEVLSWVQTRKAGRIHQLIGIQPLQLDAQQ